MIEQDTVRLLRECDAGIKMGVSSIGDVLPHVKNQNLRQLLKTGKTDHEALDRELQSQLRACRDDGKEPNPIARGMSWVKTGVKLGLENSDAAVAELMTDGCDMGVKSLSQYLNQYKAADESSKSIAKRLIDLEDKLGDRLRAYL